MESVEPTAEHAVRATPATTSAAPAPSAHSGGPVPGPAHPAGPAAAARPANPAAAAANSPAPTAPVPPPPATPGALISQVAERVAELARTVRELERLVEPPGSDPAEGGPAAAPARPQEESEFGRFAQEANLTGREAEVLRHLLDGHSNRRISRSLHISESTVKNHLHAIFVKLDTRDRTQVIAKAYRFMAEHAVRAAPSQVSPQQRQQPQLPQQPQEPPR